MKGDFHVRFCGKARVRFPCLTRLAVIINQTMEQLITFVIGLVKGLFIGAILLLVGIYAIPHSWTIRIVKFLKPSLLKDFFVRNDKFFNSILSILLDGTLTENFNDQPTIKNKIAKLREHKNDLDKTEKNMFTIDMLNDLFNTLNFAAVHYTMTDSIEVIDNISRYFSVYSNRLEETSYRRNFATEVLSRFDEMVSSMRESIEYETDESGKRMTKYNRQQHANIFAKFLKNEREQLEKTRELLLDSIKKNALDIMEQAK